MWKNSKIRIYSLILIFLFANNLLADEIKDLQSIEKLKTYYKLNIPEKLELEIIGKEYIDYLEQIRDVGERINLNSSKINSQKKRWIKASLKSNQDKKKFKVNIILHGDFNDHISLPYSSLRVKSKKNFFYQLKDFILFKPKTRRYEGEVFGSIFMREIGLISPFTRYVKLKINNNSYEDYIFQEKIGKFLIERHGFRNEPIFEYDEKNLWNRYTLGLPSKTLSSFYKLDNSTYANDQNNIKKIFR